MTAVRGPKGATVAMTQWVNVITGERLDRAAIATMRRKAHRAYEANTHIFEDEHEALAAFGAVPLYELYVDLTPAAA